MLSALSRPMNPNWRGLKARGTCSSPVRRPLTPLTRERQGSLSAGAGVLPQASGQYYKLSSHSYAASTRHKKVAQFTHGFRLDAEGATFPSSGLLEIQVARFPGLSCTLSWFETMETRSVGTASFSLPLVPRSGIVFGDGGVITGKKKKKKKGDFMCLGKPGRVCTRDF